MIKIMIGFSAEQSLEPRLYNYAERSGSVSSSRACSCKNPQPGCGCVTFCNEKTWDAVRLCKEHMEGNAACKSDKFICYGCQWIQHSDHAEYHVCRV